jgi:hypothetical protein
MKSQLDICRQIFNFTLVGTLSVGFLEHLETEMLCDVNIVLIKFAVTIKVNMIQE